MVSLFATETDCVQVCRFAVFFGGFLNNFLCGLTPWQENTQFLEGLIFKKKTGFTRRIELDSADWTGIFFFAFLCIDRGDESDINITMTSR